MAQIAQQIAETVVVNPEIARARRRRWLILGGQVGAVVGLLAIWQILSPSLDPIVFSSPTAIGTRLLQWVQDGTLWTNLLITVEEVALGYVFGGVAGILLGLLLGSSEILARILDPLLVAVYGIPKIALGPLFVVWFGIELLPKVMMAAILVFFVVFFSTYQGIRGVDKDLLHLVRLYGCTRWQEHLWITIPGAFQSIFLGLKLSVPEALIGAIVGEIIVSNRGIGYLVQFSATQLDSAGVFAGLFVLMILALIANAAVNQASRRQSM